MNANQYRHRVRILRKSYVNTEGEAAESWATYCEAWAVVSPLANARVLSGAPLSGVVARQTMYIVRTRYTDLLASVGEGDLMRLANGRTLEVTGIQNRNELNMELRFDCVETEPTGLPA